MLSAFHALPTEQRARDMKGRDYLWCLSNLLLDKEEQLEQLCPSCRAQAMQERCVVCGQDLTLWGEGMENSTFDQKRFEELKRGADHG